MPSGRKPKCPVKIIDFFGSEEPSIVKFRAWRPQHQLFLICLPSCSLHIIFAVVFSLMAENSSTWGQEENDVVCWKYSKHVTSSSSDTPSRQKKISTFDGNTSLIELTNQRSVATKSTNQITNSLRSEMHIGKGRYNNIVTVLYCQMYKLNVCIRVVGTTLEQV